VNVNTPVRATVVKLEEGGLWIYNPVAPTKECLSIIKELEAKHGEVKHIVLGSLGLEHKALAGSFSQYFPAADVWLQPGQWSWPVQLPNAFLGFPIKSKLIPSNEGSGSDRDVVSPWSRDFEYASIGPLRFKSVGGFGETAFFHKKTKTLIVTDAVVKISDEPPPIIEEDPRALLYHSRDTMLDTVADTREARLRGWRRMVLFGLFFFPSGISVSGVGETFGALPQVEKDSKILGEGSIPINGALYPWSWVVSEESSFKALKNGLLVAPILQKLILNREPDRVLQWVERVAQWPIQRIISCHYQNDIKSNAKEFRNAFAFLREGVKSPTPKELDGDFSLLNQLSDIFTKLGVVAEGSKAKGR